MPTFRGFRSQLCALPAMRKVNPSQTMLSLGSRVTPWITLMLCHQSPIISTVIGHKNIRVPDGKATPKEISEHRKTAFGR